MFKVRKAEESTNRTIRFPKSLLDKMSSAAQHESVSLNSFVVQCCEYAMNDLQKSNNNESEKYQYFTKECENYESKRF